ncbi:hypothetical protein D8674_037549 [Pyrus ussuriensis x Pyrus communis]|uniref:Uncharacterized protein n=1 Tax=Pyrus ussuriensis x Pyrus communis TaxID=2448454 RepID=A0A5N5GG77_9ROSA|nr:hypothetical protein D8674_037549 [Pyrus ussuriensis x Pyrus communis]
MRSLDEVATGSYNVQVGEERNDLTFSRLSDVCGTSHPVKPGINVTISKKVPPWAFNNACGLLDNPSTLQDKARPSGLLIILELECGEFLPSPPPSTTSANPSVAEESTPHYEDGPSCAMVGNPKRRDQDKSYPLIAEKKLKTHSFVGKLSQTAIIGRRGKRGRRVRGPKQLENRKLT